MKKALVMVYTGTLNKEAKQNSIERCNQILKDIFDNIDFYYLFSSNMINTILEKRGEKSCRIDNIVSELEKYDQVFFQPTYFTNGKEMEGFKKKLEELNFKVSYRIGETLLEKDKDLEEISTILIKEIGKKKDGEEIILIGHGLDDRVGNEYIKLEKVLSKNIENNYKIGLLKGDPNIEKVILGLERGNLVKVKIYPLMFVAGNHLQNDIENNLKLKLEGEGLEVEIIKKGVGEYDSIVSFLKNKIEGVLNI